MSELARLERAEHMLAEIQTSDDAIAVVDMVIRAVDIKVRALFKLAERIECEGEQRGGSNFRGRSLEPRDWKIRNLARQVVELMDPPTWRSFYDDAMTQEKAPHITRILRILRDERAAADREAAALSATPATRDDVDLRIGDFREVLSDVNDIDAIITDPPYGRDFLPLLGDLAAWADKALAPDGVMAVLFGQTHLNRAFELMDGGRPYRWTLCYATPRNAYVAHARRISSNWKPILLYGGGPRLNDVITTAADDKGHHEWGQDFTGIAELIRRLTAPGELVADPFLGGGTTAAGCVSTGRRFTGCDIDPEAVATTRRRLG
jgi:hypothetical protein